MNIGKLLHNVSQLPEKIVDDNPKLKRGFVWCTKCGRKAKVDSAQCLRTAWPECCNQTMTIDSPEERKQSSRLAAANRS
jgi:hypothetical protein